MGVMCHLRLFGAVDFHAPGLHATAADRIEPDVFSVAVVFRAVIQSECGCELRLVSAGCRNGVNVVFAVPFGAVGEHLSIGSDAVEVAGSKGRHQLRHAAVEENFVEAGKAVFFGVVAYEQAFAIGRKYVVVIAVVHEVAGHFDNGACFDFKFVDAAFAVVGEELSIGAPVGCLDDFVELFEKFRFAGLDIENFQERLVAAAVPDFAGAELEGVRDSPLCTEIVHLRHHLHGFAVWHLGAFFEAFL